MTSPPGGRRVRTSRKELPFASSQSPKDQLEALAAKFGTPFQLYDEQGIRCQTRYLITEFRKRFPGFRQFFAIKALPNPAILKILISEGCGLDCSSIAELALAQSIGVQGGDILFTSNYTQESDLRHAIKAGAIINLDDITLLDSIENICDTGGECSKDKKLRIPELLSFRLNPGVGHTDSETKSNVLGGAKAKFGIAPHKIVGWFVTTKRAYRRAKELGTKKFGIHMMTGSCIMREKYWIDAVSHLAHVTSHISAELDIDFEFINLGGGLGIPYKPGEQSIDVAHLADAVKNVFENSLGQHDGPDDTKCPVVRDNNYIRSASRNKYRPPPNVWMENGRFLTGPFGWLVSQCQVIKHSFGEVYYGLDACMAHLMRPGMYGAYHHITVSKRKRASTEDGAGRSPANVVGTLCENNDWFCRQRLLPNGIEVGDLFIIHDTGAHAHSMGFQYNGKLRAPEVLRRLGGERYDLIRKRESFKDLVANVLVPEDLGNFQWHAAPTAAEDALMLRSKL